MTVDTRDNPLFGVIVSVHNVVKETLRLEDRFIEPLYLLAKTAKDGVNEGWVYNNDLQEKCRGETVAKIKLALKKAFRDIIGERAESIIDIKHGSVKKLMIPKKNIKFKHVKRNPS